MCGISGQYNFASQAPVSRDAVRAMTSVIEHRGPDDEGYFFSAGVGLGFRRLSIIDIDGGHQPMRDAEQTTCIVFNGEIYNFAELREELKDYGHVFRTQSDTEVIVHGYKQWGEEVFSRLNGMFGIALWDETRRKLVLARDAMGIKQLYYRVHQGTVLFGSEMRSVLSVLERPPSVDASSVNLFLRFRYTPAPATLYEGINKLAPGTLAVFEGGDWQVRRWYRFAPTTMSPPRSPAEAREELLEVYRRAMKRHLISDVPVGLLLSGGMDSGLLLGLMSEHGDGWPSYTVGYGKSAYEDDELVDAAESAELFGSSNTQVSLTQSAFEESLPKIVSALEEPVATSSIVPMYFLCQRARQDVKVALMGQGPDELFGGYTRHLGVHYGRHYRALPGFVQSGLAAGIERLPRQDTLKRAVNSLGTRDDLLRYQQVFSIMPGAVVNSLFRDATVSGLRGAEAVVPGWRALEPFMDGTDELGKFQLLELRSSLPDELLMYADKLSMAHSLEVRVPFLDKEVVEYAQCLPASMKIRLGERKWLHRQVCKSYLPDAILRRKKRGFAVNVVDRWFNQSMGGKLRDVFHDSSSLMFDMIEQQPVMALLDEHRSGRRDNHKLLFSLVVLEEWLRAGSQATQAAREGALHVA